MIRWRFKMIGRLNKEFSSIERSAGRRDPTECTWGWFSSCQTSNDVNDVSPVKTLKSLFRSETIDSRNVFTVSRGFSSSMIFFLEEISSVQWNTFTFFRRHEEEKNPLSSLPFSSHLSNSFEHRWIWRKWIAKWLVLSSKGIDAAPCWHRISIIDSRRRRKRNVQRQTIDFMIVWPERERIEIRYEMRRYMFLFLLPFSLRRFFQHLLWKWENKQSVSNCKDDFQILQSNLGESMIDNKELISLLFRWSHLNEDKTRVKGKRERRKSLFKLSRVDLDFLIRCPNSMNRNGSSWKCERRTFPAISNFELEWDHWHIHVEYSTLKERRMIEDGGGGGGGEEWGNWPWRKWTLWSHVTRWRRSFCGRRTDEQKWK